MNDGFPALPVRRRRRAGVYLAVLGVSMLVTLIGLSGVLATRVARRGAALSLAAAQADTAAQCYMDVVLYRLTHDLYWRLSYANDTWTTAESCGGASASFKLVDELDSDLTDDETEPARIYCRASVGEAMRMYSMSVTCTPAVTGNLISNPGAESGTTDWYGYNCNLTAVTGPRHSGAAAFMASSRTDCYGGPTYTVSGFLEENQPYELEAWARTASGSVNVRFLLCYCDSTSGCRTVATAATTVVGNWTKVSGTLTPNTSGSLTDSYVNISTESGTVTLYVDDVIIREAGSSKDAKLIPVPGTFRREISS